MKQQLRIWIGAADACKTRMASALIALVAALPAVGDQPMRVACVGDSITFGHGIADPNKNSYPAQLARLLGEKYEVRNFGRSGASMLKRSNRPYWTQPEFAAAQKFVPHVVILMLGTNDTQAVNWQPYRAEFADDCTALITAFRTLESKPRIVVCLPPPLFRDRGKDWDTDAVLRNEIVPQIREVAAREELPVVDLYEVFRGKAELLPDGVHLNAAGAKLCAEHVAAAINELFVPAQASATSLTSSPRDP